MIVWLSSTAILSLPHSVMPGLEPGIHEQPVLICVAWMAGPSPAMTDLAPCRLLRRHRRRRLGDREAQGAGADVHGGAVRDAAFEDLLRQRVLQLALDHPLQGPRAVDRVVA